MDRRNLQVCLSPALFDEFKDLESIIVVIDTLRATSAVCNAFENGAIALIPVAGIDEAEALKDTGSIVAAERDGIVLDFADFGNSPFNFTRENVEGKTIVYSTTNGTRTIEIAADCKQVVLGSFLNITSLTNWLISTKSNVILLCAGWKNKVNIEDSVFAGALATRLLNSGLYETDCDSTKIVLDLWKIAEPDLLTYIDKAAQRSRLRDKGLDDCIPFCHEPDSTTVIPVLENDRLVKLNAVL